ncbi:STAS domain-containing protein [Streptomyces lichenis]|uniref:Anti-sigma factor antagonist n=1 Tax=Streptomyces lichenis TaxID=2306967 RepID=A0ABT0I5C5_9ACTN|nr:STAS domain-containing protein [Streptomyces lichenis]MCK8676482.1 STAS domain-containing protein [Streptomyces lichenis]
MADTQHAAQPGRLSVRTTTGDDGIRILTVTGEIDHHTAGPLQQALALPEGSAQRTVVDLQQVSFMDSTGINIFIAAHRAHAEAGSWLRLAALTDAVRRTMQIVGVDAVIDCRPDLDQALTA